MNLTSRRNFIKTGFLAGVSLSANYYSFGNLTFQMNNPYYDNELLNLSYELLQNWCDGLINYQISDPKFNGMYGGILCPACSRIHGRIGDAVFPFMFLAEKTKKQNYLDAALQIYNWSEREVSCYDGSWVNDVNISSWKGTTVFAAISRAEALINFEHLLEKKTANQWKQRLDKAAAYVYNTFSVEKSNINYPASGAYALSLTGKYLDNKKYKEKGRHFAKEILKYFTKKNKFLNGEGRNWRNSNISKDKYFIDLGYNVEESLPCLVLYARLMEDNEVLDIVTESLNTHAEFLLPDGAWDNSWGTRNFKWTWWGSRTSDGCQPAYALMADKNPVFFKVALENTKLLKNCTHNNLLYGGPHYTNHKIQPCIHHTFCHSKALTSMLVKEKTIEKQKFTDKIILPREKQYGIKEFKEIKTLLISNENWKATITGYDVNYRHRKGGHASGGALSMLWHNKIGAVVTAGMSRFQLWESMNMQVNKDEMQMPLTPRFEIDIDDKKYMNIYDFGAQINHKEENNICIIYTKSKLLDENREFASEDFIHCQIIYTFYNNKIVIKGNINSESSVKDIKYVLPVISPNHEQVTVVSKNELHITKPDGKLVVKCNVPMHLTETKKGRIFNFVPGMEALPVEVQNDNFEIEILVH
jgi:hypothetical protein